MNIPNKSMIYRCTKIKPCLLQLQKITQPRYRCKLYSSFCFFSFFYGMKKIIEFTTSPQACFRFHRGKVREVFKIILIYFNNSKEASLCLTLLLIKPKVAYGTTIGLQCLCIFNYSEYLLIHSPFCSLG